MLRQLVEPLQQPRGLSLETRCTHLDVGWISVVAVVACMLAYAIMQQLALGAPPGASIAPHLQERFGLSEPQVRGALGALLVFVRERMPKPEFAAFAQRIPQADSSERDMLARVLR